MNPKLGSVVLPENERKALDDEIDKIQQELIEDAHFYVLDTSRNIADAQWQETFDELLAANPNPNPNPNSNSNPNWQETFEKLLAEEFAVSDCDFNNEVQCSNERTLPWCQD